MDSDSELDLMALAITLIREKKKKRKRKIWVQEMYKNRDTKGIHLHLVPHCVVYVRNHKTTTQQHNENMTRLDDPKMIFFKHSKEPCEMRKHSKQWKGFKL